eukprot:1791524-Heterocapsa_arctica.AAC.1
MEGGSQDSRREPGVGGAYLEAGPSVQLGARRECLPVHGAQQVTRVLNEDAARGVCSCCRPVPAWPGPCAYDQVVYLEVLVACPSPLRVQHGH